MTIPQFKQRFCRVAVLTTAYLLEYQNKRFAGFISFIIRAIPAFTSTQKRVMMLFRAFLDGNDQLGISLFKESCNHLPVSRSNEFLFIGNTLSCALFELGRYDSYVQLSRIIGNYFFNNPHATYNAGIASLIALDLEGASFFIEQALGLNSKLRKPHHNFADNINTYEWSPQALDLSSDMNLFLYDACHIAGQKLVNIGDAKRALKVFSMAADLQEKLAASFEFNFGNIQFISTHENYNPNIPTVILGPEWVSQIGHIGMIDAFLKMQHLGYYKKANIVLLAPKKNVANKIFLEHFDRYLIRVTDGNLIDQLFPLQRIFGVHFNFYKYQNGVVEDWSDTAARAFIEWDRKDLPPLIEISKKCLKYGDEIIKAMNIPNGAKIIALHIRSSGYYSESLFAMQRHRNSRICDYIPGVEDALESGAYIIRMGDKSMPKLPRRLRSRKNVIDYAHSLLKSEYLDVYLWSQSDLFVGTTSGPTNAVVAFGTPCLLINCATNYSQSWNSKVTFMPKLIFDKKADKFLTLKEATHPAVRCKIMNYRTFYNSGYRFFSNSPQNIRDAIVDRLISHNGRVGEFQNQRIELDKEYVFGGAQISPAFLKVLNDKNIL